MSRGTRIRCLAVWTAVTVALVALLAGLGGDALTVGATETWQGAFERLLVAACSLAVLGCGAWCWWVTTLTTAEVLRGGGRVGARTGGGATRRAVLVLCGVAVAAQLTGPAAAADSAAERLHGLSLPERAVAPASAAPREARVVVVRTGDTLWSLAETSLGPHATAARTTGHWREIYAANRAALGPDPDLIHPGQRLRLPSPSDHNPHSHPEEQR